MNRHIKSLVEENQLEEAIDELEKICSNQRILREQIVPLRSRLSHLIDENIQGVIRQQDYLQRWNQIGIAIVKISGDLMNQHIHQPALKERYNFQLQTVLDSDIPVSSLYVSPTYSRYDYYLEVESDESRFVATGEDIEKKANDFLDSSHSTPNVLLILGYPGQGKSTLCMKLCHDLIERKDSRVPYFVALKNLNIKDSKSLIDNPLPLLLNQIQSTDIPQPITGLLVLDGLDELFMKNGLSHDNLYQICDQLQQSLEINHPEAKVIISSRLNYISNQRLTSGRFEIVKLDEFDLVQQKAWVKKYLKFQPECKLNGEILERYWKQKEGKSNDQSIPELLGQPLTLYMVASLNINLHQVSAKAAIYQQLFKEVILRRYSKGGVHKNLARLRPQTLRKALRQIAVEIYFSNQEFITNQDAEKIEALTKVQQELKTGNLPDALRNLMMSFYFQDKEVEGQDGVFALEFLHKSLQEFLVAEYIWEAFKNLSGDQDSLEVFVHHTLARLSRREISEEVLKTIREMVNLYLSTRPEKEAVIQLWNRWLDAEAIAASNDFLPKGIYSAKVKLTLSPIQIMNNVKKAFHLIMETVGGDFFYKANEEDPRKFTSLSLTNYFKRNSRRKRKHAFISRKYSFGNYFSNSDLSDLDLGVGKFSKVSFENSQVLNCDFRDCIFEECNFKGINFEKVNFRSSQFLNCIFDEAYFGKNIDLYGAWFRNCSFKRTTILSNTETKRCTFDSPNFEEARLQHFSFYKGIPGASNFSKAHLQGSFLGDDDYDIFNVFFTQANLQNAKVRYIQICCVDFSQADMTGMKIFEPEFTMVNFTDAKGLTYEMFQNVRTMYKIKGLPEEIETRMKKERPEIWQKPKWYDQRIKNGDPRLMF